MDNIFTNSENSKSSEPHVLVLKLTNKLDLRIGVKIIALSNLNIYYTWKNINNKLKISAPTWNDTFELHDGSYSVSDIQDYFKKSMEKILINHQYRYMYIKLKTGLHLKLKIGITLNF